MDQPLHFVAPFWAFIGAANAPQIVQGAEDLGQPLQVAVERRGGVLGARRAQIACRDEDESGQNRFEHDLLFDAPSNGYPASLKAFRFDPVYRSGEAISTHDPAGYGSRA